MFEPSYFNFMWQFCGTVPKSIGSEVTLHTTKLAASFLLETLVHSREKPHMKGWVELLMFGFEHSSEVCEWLLNQMAEDDWWLQQLFIRCPAQHLRQVRTFLMALFDRPLQFFHGNQCEIFRNCWCERLGSFFITFPLQFPLSFYALIFIYLIRGSTVSCGVGLFT